MRDIPAAIAAARAERAGIISHHLVWIEARDRATGNNATLGFWTGDDHQDFTIGGTVRTYYGAGVMAGKALPEFVQEIGVQVREHQLTFSGIAPEVELVVRGYDVRLAPCEIHRAEFSTEDERLLAPPIMVVDGEVSGVNITTPAEGGDAKIALSILSNAVMLTRSLPRKRSDESLRARRPNDPFLQYAKISGSNGDPWGAKNA
ncbi:hypothetical protein [Falsirhodobacter halotolerans]|uniref:hypothetical protein n=1 Tax=Falsirhodobacter halotolerans TaxID=1146892 RepID=UPI001FD438DF|nr:hypothetical protein [Falsirhodobacter halotolerans]MCJ8139350.1 hypothetical protein [Falsirhodobacter halotolerans]